jgi:hypothetical protein
VWVNCIWGMCERVGDMMWGGEGKTDSGITVQSDKNRIRGVRIAACGECENVIGGCWSCVSICILSMCNADSEDCEECGSGIRGVTCRSVALIS